MTTYAEAKAASDALTLEAEIAADIATEGADLTGYDEMSTQKALIRNAARAREAEQGIRSELVQAIDPAVLVTMDDAWVDQILKGRYQEDRLPALAAQGTLVVTVTTGATYQAGDLLVQDDESGAYFRNTNAAPTTIIAGDSATIAFEAVEAGAASNPLSGATFAIVRGTPGATIGVTVATWTTTRAGSNAESNIAYLARCQAKWGTLGAGGSIDAYNYWIPTPLGAGYRWIVRDDNPAGPGTIWVYLANSSGPATTQEIATLQAYLDARKALGSSTLTVYAASTQAVAVTASSTFSGSSKIANQTAALALLEAALPMGALIDTNLIASLLRGQAVPTVEVSLVNGDTFVATVSAPAFAGVTDVDLTLPAADVQIPAGTIADFTVTLS